MSGFCFCDSLEEAGVLTLRHSKAIRVALDLFAQSAPLDSEFWEHSLVVAINNKYGALF